MALQLAPLSRPACLSDQVVTSIQTQIATGRLAPGTRLPSEVILAESLGVSRPVLREGLARLRADGFVTSRRGAGLVVADRPGLGTFKLPGTAGAPSEQSSELFELRLIVECAAAELAAQRRSDEDLDGIQSALAAVDRALVTGDNGAAADEAFHLAVARASGNGQLARFAEFLGASFTLTRAPAWTSEGQARGAPRAAQAEHVEIFEAIRAGAGTEAAAAARRHLMQSAARNGVALPRSVEGSP